ncbi:MAG: TlpA family protein disulfide reductase [Acidobacteriia bacterium]|nr:TlpA family protein disulfide reductase [Terriglobia bacterium]
MSRCPPALFVLVVAGLPLCGQPCDPSSDVKAAMDAATRAGGNAENRIAAAQKVRDQFPRDYFAHRFYQNQFVIQRLFSKFIQDKYRAVLEQHADDDLGKLYGVLYARTLVGTNTPEAIKILDRVLELDPADPQAHLNLVEIYAAPAFRDDAKLIANADGYWKACPSSLSGYTYIGRVTDPDFAARNAVRLRTALESRTDDEAVSMYPILWELEFKPFPLMGQVPILERVRRDVEMLRAQDNATRLTAVRTLAEGYKILGDTEGAKWVRERLPQPTPPAGMAFMEASSKWSGENRTAGSDYQNISEKLARQTEEWIRQWPDDPRVRQERFQALQSADSVPLEEALRAAEEWIQTYERRPDGTPSPYLQVANFYGRMRVRFDQIPGLLEKALQERAPEPPIISDLVPARTQTVTSYNPHLAALESASRLYIQIKRYDRAREMLAELGPALDKLRPAPGTSVNDKRTYALRRSNYWNTMMRLAQIEGRKNDALEHALSGARVNQEFDSARTASDRTRLLAMYKEVHGSDDGFNKWFGLTAPPAPTRPTATVATPGSWTTLDKPLPEIEIQDAAGKVWYLADLKGKVTLINLWATWCGPCRNELPYLQQLYDKVRERKDLQVITLNTDDNLGLILPFMKENKYTFPVLPARGYVDGLVPELSIPRNWIVDAGGVLRSEKIGFGTGDAAWVDDIIRLMEAARPAR